MDTAVTFTNVSFSYPKREIEVVDGEILPKTNTNETTEIFGSISAELPAGMMSLVGQNGIGKSTLLLLAGGRIFPHTGSIEIFGKPTNDFADAAIDPAVEHERNRYVSFVYQNMEFESEETVGELLEFVYENGFYEKKDSSFIPELIKTLELESATGKKTQHLAKGQLQRAIIAFSLLYGSKMIMMDEPVFACEEPQKDRIFGFLLEFSRANRVPIYYSAHNLELTQKYSDYMLLLDSNRNFKVGPTEELFERKEIEAAYQAPMDALYRRDALFRDVLTRSAKNFGSE
ncbi:MAG: ATP-binding cassette domain-containing protein [Spirochaetales bacterium]